MNEYERQTQKFLEDTGTTFEIVRIGTFKHFPDDKEDRDVYSVTLSNRRGTYNFNFGDSIHNTRRRQFAASGSRDVRYAKKCGFSTKGVCGCGTQKELLAARRHKPGLYDVLSCLTTYHPGTFEDFCSEYGYDEDSRKAFDVYQAVLKEFGGISRLFTNEQLEQLVEIS